MTTASSSSLPEPGLIEVPLDRLHAHPANPNVMSAERAAKLVRHIAAEGRYPPLVARPHPEPDDHWQLLDGHQRLAALKTLGHETATVFPWPCDDAAALLLLGTLNALSGSDDPLKRAQLLEELAALRPIEELVLLLPEEERELEDALSLLALDVDACLAELEAAAAPGPQSPVRSPSRCAARTSRTSSWRSSGRWPRSRVITGAVKRSPSSAAHTWSAPHEVRR